MHPIEFTWYKAIVLITSALALVVGIINIVYFNKIRLNPSNCAELSTTEANTGLWLNVFLVIFAGILFFWSLFRLIFTGEPEKELVHKTYNTIHHSPEETSVKSISSISHEGSPISSISPQRTIYHSPEGTSISSISHEGSPIFTQV